MYGSWTETKVMWRKFLGFFWDIKNVLMMYNYWVWAQSRRSKSSIWLVSIWELVFKKLFNNHDVKFNKLFRNRLRR